MNKTVIKKNILKSSFALLLFYTFLFTGCGETQTGILNIETAGPQTLVKQAKSIVQAGLEDNNPRVRATAVEVVASAGRMDMMPAVEQMLTDDFVPVRFSTALAIGDTRYSSARVKLTTLLKKSDDNTRLSANYALYKLGDKTKFSAIAQQLTSKDMTLRANAALLIGKAGNKDGIALLRQAIDAKDADDKVRLQAAESLAELGDQSIYPKLWTIVLNVNADVRIVGTLAMGALGTEQARGALTTLLSDPVLEIRLVAAEQLGKLGFQTGEPEVLEVFTKNLTDAMDKEGQERVYCLTAQAIGQIKTPALTKYLPKLLKNESNFVRLTAAKAVLLIYRTDLAF
jgi:HEAT repeat protein